MIWMSGILGLLAGALLSALYARHALQVLRRELEGWRSKHESALLERVKFESEAARVPALATRVEALLAELSQVKADNAQAQVRLEGQARAHEKEVATLKDLRGGIDEELKQLTAEAEFLGKFSRPILEQAIKGGVSAEVKKRIEKVLEQIPVDVKEDDKEAAPPPVLRGRSVSVSSNNGVVQISIDGKPLDPKAWLRSSP